MRKTLLACFAAAVGFSAVSAHATPIRLDGPEANLQTIVNGLPGGSLGTNVLTDQVALDEVFTLTGFTGFAGIVVEHAGFKDLNSFGIYDVYDPSKRVQIFSGADGAGAMSFFSLDSFTSGLFGFYLDTPAGLWFSESGKNSDGADHMVAYKRGGQYLFGWEDLASNGWDQDYNDFVVLISGVESVSVPEPATLGLFGLSLAGLSLLRRRKQAA